MENKIDEVLKKLKEKHKIYDKVCHEIYLIGSSPVTLYSLYEIHRSVIDEPTPFRAILSAEGAPTYKFTIFFVPLLEPLTFNSYTI